MPSTATTASAALHAVIEHHRSVGEQLYGIVDAARDPALARAAFERFGLDRWSLFPRDTASWMTAVAPYLIPIPIETRHPFAATGLLDLWAERLGNSAGILLTSTTDLRTLWEHLQEIFLASDVEGNEFFFRYYDPRVLRGFLPSLERSEPAEFFGPVRQIFVEGAAQGELLICRSGAGRVTINQVKV